MARTLAIGVLAVLAAGACQATDQLIEGQWIAYSRTARSITGDIWFSSTSLRSVDVEMPFRVVTKNQRFDVDGESETAKILALTPPSDPELLNGNTFGCGGKPVRWIAVWHEADGKLVMATFDGDRMPTSLDGPGFCASYYYERPS